MTEAEAKVNEFANKILDYIEQSEQQQADPKWILQGVKGYICGMSDGIEFAEEMRVPDYDVQARMIRWIGAPCRIVSEKSWKNYLNVEELEYKGLLSL